MPLFRFGAASENLLLLYCADADLHRGVRANLIFSLVQ
jgi:hypothetical protein